MRLYLSLRAFLVVAAMLVAGLPLLSGSASAALPVLTVSDAPRATWAPWKACDNSSANCATVRAIIPTASGTTYLGGDFTELRSPGRTAVPVSKVAALGSDGAPLPGFVPPSFNGTVYTLATDGVSLFAGGAFSSPGLAVAKLDATTGAKGYFPTGIRNASGTVGVVRASALVDGTLYIGGKFDAVQGVARGNLAALDAASGKLQAAWAPTATLIEGDARPNDALHNDVPVRTMKATPDGSRLYVGGDLDRTNGVDRPALVALDRISGALDEGFDATAALRTNGFQAKSFQGMQVALIDSTAPGGAGLVLAAGGLTNRAFRLDLTGRLGYLINLDGDAQAAAYADGTVYLGGHFTKVCPQSCYPEVPADQCDELHVCRIHMVALPDAKFSDPVKMKPAPTPDWSPVVGATFSPYYYGVWTLETQDGDLHTGGVYNNVTSDKVYAQPKYAVFPAKRVLATPAAPSVRPVSGSSSRLELDWPPVEGAASYEVFRGTSERNLVSLGERTGPFTDEGLQAGTGYVYRVAALSPQGRSHRSGTGSSATLPPAPSGLTAALAAGTTDSVDLSWQAAPTAEAYDVELSTDGLAWTAAPRTIETSTRLSGLAPDSDYRFRVRATRADGAGPWTDPPARLTTPATAPPEPVAGLRASAVDGTAEAVDVSWTPAAAGQRAHSYDVYRADESPEGRHLVTTAAAPTTTVRVDGLSPATSYSFFVAARNDVGASAAAGPAEITTGANNPPPGVPSGTVVAPVGGTSDRMTVSWSAVAGATSYDVERTAGTDAAVVRNVAAPAAGAAPSLVDTGLAPDTRYSYRVRAVNDNGVSAFGEPAAATTLPAPPTGVTATFKDRAADVRWTVPANPNGAITGYRIRRFAGTGDTLQAVTDVAGADVSLFTATGLTNGSTYSFDVSALSARGVGSPSARSNAVTPCKPPTAPVIGTALPGDAGGTVTATAVWSPPSFSGGSPVTGYRVTALRMSSSDTVLSRTVSAWLPGDARHFTMTLPSAGDYRFTVQAQNIAGTSNQSARSNLVAGQ